MTRRLTLTPLRKPMAVLVRDLIQFSSERCLAKKNCQYIEAELEEMTLLKPFGSAAESEDISNAIVHAYLDSSSSHGHADLFV